MAWLDTELSQAQRNIGDARRQTARRKMIRELSDAGCDTKAAEALLESMLTG